MRSSDYVHDQTMPNTKTNEVDNYESFNKIIISSEEKDWKTVHG